MTERVRSRLSTIAVNSVLVVGSLLLTLAGFEVFLWASAIRIATPAPAASPVAIPSAQAADEIAVPAELVARAEQRKSLLTMPDEWKQTPTQVPGANFAYNWQGVLHVYDGNGFRRTTGFPQKPPGTYRVLVFGDSLTYGMGLREEDGFVARLNEWMGQRYRAEFLNLGSSGAQSEDILANIKRFVPALQPDLVIYAVCLNDFLPSGQGEYNYFYAFPLPENVKQFLIAHTYTGAFLNDAYDAALRRLHLRRDFFDDVLYNFAGLQMRFARDVGDMNAFVRAAGLPPMVAMVLDQYPNLGGKGQQITRIAEKALTDAGMNVISTEDYYRRYSGKAMYVSRWEGHPNEVANYIWATMLLRSLSQRSDIGSFAR
jgi:hypothetical protein